MSTFNDTPKIGEKVLVQFTKQMDGYFEAKLIDYTMDGIMNFKDATKKRKVYSWNQIVPLNKEMVAVVEDIYSNTIQLSLAYFEDGTFKDLDVMQIQKQLMIPFNENKLIKKFITSLCILHNYDFNMIWNQFINELKSTYEDYIDVNDTEISMWEYMVNNFNDFIDNCDMDDNIIQNIKQLFEKRNEEVDYNIVSKIGIISIGGVPPMKELLNKITTNINYQYSLKYDTAPYYLFQTNSLDTSDDTHIEFIKQLELESSKMIPKVFIKVDYMAKH
jgi:translation initiation factor 2 alpha subunit (eIF-2alpha)